MEIYNNFLTKEEQLEIFNLLSSAPFAWYLYDKSVPEKHIDNVSIPDKKTKETFQFGHTLRSNNEIYSEYYDYVINNIFNKFLVKNNVTCNKILRAKVNLTTSVLDNDFYQTPHIDTKLEHKVFLYYVNDSDGKTIMFNEKYNGEKQELTIKDSVLPEMGKAILFDGLSYHAPTPPKNTPFRIVINIDFI